jgi:hypothetical protein
MGVTGAGSLGWFTVGITDRMRHDRVANIAAQTSYLLAIGLAVFALTPTPTLSTSDVTIPVVGT